MKKVLVLLVALALCLGMVGCNAEGKLMAKVEEKIFSYEFSSADVDNLERLASSKVFQKWIAKLAPKIMEGAFSELEVSALIDNLDRAKIYNEEIRDAYLKFVGKGSFEEELKKGNVIEVLKQLKNKTYYNTVANDFYCIYRKETVKAKAIWEAAKAQLAACNLKAGFYDVLENRKEKEAGDDGGLLKWEWVYFYKGDFCVEEKRTFHYSLGVEISGKDGVPREYTVYYKGQEIQLSPDAIKDAEEIFVDVETNAFVAYTKSEKIFTSFGVTVG